MDLFNSEAFSNHVSELMEEWHAPGLAISLVQGDVTAAKGFGYAILEGDEQAPTTGDTVWDIASSSKSMTAAAIALLVEDDENHPHVQWDTLVFELLPDDFVMPKDEYTKSVTVEDILSHRSGLPGHDFSYLSPRAKHPDTLRSVTRNIRNLEISDPIRTKWMYCNMMFTVAAYLVEQLSGLSFEDFLRKHFWDPLGMKSTILQPTKAVEAGFPIAQPYIWDKKAKKYNAVERQYSPEATGAGLIVTSVNDYLKWVRAMMERKPPVSQDVYEGITKLRSFPDNEDDDDPVPFSSPMFYAAGLEVNYYRGYQMISHDGGDPGVTSKHFFLPQIKFGGVMIANAGSGFHVISVVMRGLIDEALGIPQAERIDWTSWKRKEIEEGEKKEEDERLEARRKLCPESDGEPQEQKTPLDKYTAVYSNTGYHDITVEINKNDKLFIDMSDRTMGFTLELEHLCNQTKYIAHFRDYYEGEHLEFAAEFEFEGEKAVRIGIDLEGDLKSKRVWFDRVDTLPLRMR